MLGFGMEYETIRSKAKFYKNNVRAVHISKKDFKFHNGIILKVRGDFLIIDDEKFGETPIFFAEINDIEPREPKVGG